MPVSQLFEFIKVNVSLEFLDISNNNISHWCGSNLREHFCTNFKKIGKKPSPESC